MVNAPAVHLSTEKLVGGLLTESGKISGGGLLENEVESLLSSLYLKPVNSFVHVGQSQDGSIVYAASTVAGKTNYTEGEAAP